MRTSYLLVGFVAAALLAGCSSVAAPGEPPNGQGADSTPTTTSAPGPEAAITPDVPRAQQQELAAERQDRLESCFTEAGFTITPAEGGGITVDYGDDEASFDRVAADCEKRAGPVIIPAPPSPAEASEMYDLFLKARQCLIGNGATPSEPTSRELFVSTYLAGSAPWSPFDGIDFVKYSKLCPEPSLFDLG